jgi:hypothetical protein
MTLAELNEQRRAYHRAYYETNRDRINEQKRAQYEANKDRVKEQRRAHRVQILKVHKSVYIPPMHQSSRPEPISVQVRPGPPLSGYVTIA